MDDEHTFESLEHGISGWGILHFYSQVDLVIAAGSRTLLEYPGLIRSEKAQIRNSVAGVEDWIA